MRVGLIGYPVKHSISPIFQQAAFDALGIDARYELWETPPEQVAEAAALLRQPDCLGANVTIPHKQAMLRYVDVVDGTAEAIGAINTIVRRADGCLAGFNTDVEGFARAIQEDAATTLRSKRVVVLGSGGAARAVVASSLADRVAELVICARRPASAQLVLDEFARRGFGAGCRSRAIALRRDSPETERAIRECNILVNATPVGMAGHSDDEEMLFPAEWLSSNTLVCDLIYNPPLTPLLRAARQRGARVLNGLPMLVNQGAAAFERWTGHSAPIELMRRKAMEALGG